MQSEQAFLWWAGPLAARDYRSAKLRSCDAARSTRIRTPKAELDWRVSRALMQHALPRAGEAVAPLSTSLSHCRGHALLASAPAGWRIGVDLEMVRPREVRRLAEWCCTPQEMASLLAREGTAQLEYFYLLWTLKEAFVKAAGLDFPADMRTVGLSPEADGGHLRAPAGAWQALVVALAPHWVASVVWACPAQIPGEPVWRATAIGALPQRRALGRWCS